MMITHATRLATLLSIGLASCASSNCEKRSIASTDSPDAKYSVVVYTLDCGATAATATHVALKKARGVDAFDVFVADGESGKVKAQWIGGREVVIKHGSGRVFKEEKTWNDVAIRYEVED
jgi:hypothetical protein